MICLLLLAPTRDSPHSWLLTMLSLEETSPHHQLEPTESTQQSPCSPAHLSMKEILTGECRCGPQWKARIKNLITINVGPSDLPSTPAAQHCQLCLTRPTQSSSPPFPLESPLVRSPRKVLRLATRESTNIIPCPPTVMENTTAPSPLETSPATTHPPRKNALTSKSS